MRYRPPARVVITLEGCRVGHVAAHLRQPVLPIRAPVTFQQRHFITVLFVHDLVDQQQTRTEIRVQQVPVAARILQCRTDLFDFLGGEDFRRQRRGGTSCSPCSSAAIFSSGTRAVSSYWNNCRPRNAMATNGGVARIPADTIIIKRRRISKFCTSLNAPRVTLADLTI